MPRGGPRTPNDPSPVSGPGAMSSRTDGSVNNPTAPPLTDAPSEQYGERAARNRGIRAAPTPQQSSQQGAAPGAGQPSSASGPGGPAAGAGPQQIPDFAEQLFGPDTSSPSPLGGSRERSRNRIIPENRYAFLEEVHRADPNPDTLELLQMARGRKMYLDEEPRGNSSVYPEDSPNPSIDPDLDMDFNRGANYGDIQDIL